MEVYYNIETYYWYIKQIFISLWGLIHCKNSFGINSIIYLYKEDHYTVQNKSDLDSGSKTKTSNLAL